MPSRPFPRTNAVGTPRATMRHLAAETGDDEIACLQTDIAEFYALRGWEVWRGALAGRGERRPDTDTRTTRRHGVATAAHSSTRSADAVVDRVLTGAHLGVVRRVGIAASIPSGRGVTIVRHAGLAQSVEHFSCKEDVVGSIPTPGSKCSRAARLSSEAVRTASTCRSPVEAARPRFRSSPEDPRGRAS